MDDDRQAPAGKKRRVRSKPLTMPYEEERDGPIEQLTTRVMVESHKDPEMQPFDRETARKFTWTLVLWLGLGIAGAIALAVYGGYLLLWG